MQRLELVVRGGGVKPIVVLCAGQGGFDAKPVAADTGGKKGKSKKKGKKGKAPPVTPEMEEVGPGRYRSPRHMTPFSPRNEGSRRVV